MVGFNPMEKQSSTISNKTVLSLMEKYGFAVQILNAPIAEKKADREAIRSAKRDFGQCAHISLTGESVFFSGHHVENKHAVSDIRVKLSNMVGIGERKALFKATGIPELNPNPERRLA